MASLLSVTRTEEVFRLSRRSLSTAGGHGVGPVLPGSAPIDAAGGGPASHEELGSSEPSSPDRKEATG